MALESKILSEIRELKQANYELKQMMLLLLNAAPVRMERAETPAKSDYRQRVEAAKAILAQKLSRGAA
jgi:hypothetical protein